MCFQTNRDDIGNMSSKQQTDKVPSSLDIDLLIGVLNVLTMIGKAIPSIMTISKLKLLCSLCLSSDETEGIESSSSSYLLHSTLQQYRLVKTVSKCFLIGPSYLSTVNSGLKQTEKKAVKGETESVANTQATLISISERLCAFIAEAGDAMQDRKESDMLLETQ